MNFVFTPPTNNHEASSNELLDILQSKLDAIDDKNQPKRVKEDKWEPKDWKVEYEAIVFMHLQKMSGVEIAQRTGFTPQHIYNILGTDRAIEIEKALIGKVRNESINVVDELKEIQKLTVSRLRKSLQDDNKFDASPLGFISKGLEVMKGMGEHLKTQPNMEIKNTINIPPSIIERFLEGLEKSDKVKVLLANPEKQEVEEASFEVVEEENVEDSES